jgi:hypothetical protein
MVGDYGGFGGFMFMSLASGITIKVVLLRLFAS